MASNFMQGEDCRCQIALATSNEPTFTDYYSIKKFAIRYVRPRLDVPNSEGRCGNSQRDDDTPGYGTAVRGLRTIELTIEEATLDWTLTQNIFDNPYQIKNEDYLWVKIFPNRDDESQYHLVHLQVEEVSHEGEVGGLQPVSFKGTSDGQFTLLGE